MAAHWNLHAQSPRPAKRASEADEIVAQFFSIWWPRNHVSARASVLHVTGSGTVRPFGRGHPPQCLALHRCRIIHSRSARQQVKDARLQWRIPSLFPIVQAGAKWWSVRKSSFMFTSCSGCALPRRQLGNAVKPASATRSRR